MDLQIEVSAEYGGTGVGSGLACRAKFLNFWNIK